jgi:hypothetical protein
MNRNHLIALAILVITGGIACEPGVTRDDDDFREDVLYCENAVAHIEDCCHIGAARDVCRYHRLTRTSDCGCLENGSTRHEEEISPVFPVGESRDLLDASCEDVDCNTMTERLAKADAHESDEGQCTSTGVL